MEDKTITINGYVYDRHTGIRLHRAEDTAKPVSHVASDVHQTVQKSTTLRRRYVSGSKPTSFTIQPSEKKDVASQAAPSIKKFAAHPIGATKPKTISDIGPTKHPVARKAETKNQTPATAFKPSDMIRREEIDRALNAPAVTKKTDRIKVKKQRSAFQRFGSLASASLAVLLLGGYFTYINMPSISTRVAASQAGIEASFPAYRPSGYSLSGPVAYDSGTVSMNFVANAGPRDFTLKQQRSGWDSSAVLENYIQPKAGDNYSVATKNGLTIYTFQNNAAWVNKGILYTVEGSASLSPDQIQNIATSL